MRIADGATVLDFFGRAIFTRPCSEKCQCKVILGKSYESPHGVNLSLYSLARQEAYEDVCSTDQPMM